MLVKVNKDYAGMYGLFNDIARSVTIKTNKDAMFEEKDEVAERLIKKGVLVKASLNDEIMEADEEIRKEGTKSDLDEDDGEEEYLDEDNHLDEMTWDEIRKYAKDLGINSANVSREKLTEMILEAENNAPEINALDPV